MANYKSPAVLNPPLIGVMVASVAIPVVAYLFYYNAQVNELERLERVQSEQERELQRMLGVINTHETVIRETRDAEILLDHFSTRFLRSAADAQQMLNDSAIQFIREVDAVETLTLDGNRRRPGDTDEEEGDFLRNFPFQGELSRYFDGAYFREFLIQGTYEGLLESLQRIYDLEWPVHYPRAAYVRLTLPDGVDLPDLEETERRDAIVRDPNELPLFFERDYADETGRTGNVWFLCRPRGAVSREFRDEIFNMTDDQKRRAIALASGSDRWQKAIERLQQHIAQERPMVPESIHYNVGTNVPTCSKTGLPVELHYMRPFFYIDTFEFQADRRHKDRHRIRLRFVVPIWNASKVEAALAGTDQANDSN